MPPAAESHPAVKAKAAGDRAEAERLADVWLERLLIFGERAGGTINGDAARVEPAQPPATTPRP